MRVGSLFTGYGGLDMAACAATGGTIAWTSDVPEHDREGSLIGNAPRIIAHRHPGVPNLGDITKVDWRRVEPIDVLTGGSPCTDISTVGRMAGLAPGTRSNLWVEMLTAAAVLRPRLVIWENVRAALTTRADSDLEQRPRRVGDLRSGPALRVLGRVLGGLADLGYDAEWVMLPASGVGACHRRYRVFLAAHAPGDTGWLAQRDARSTADTRGEHRDERRISGPGEAPGRGTLSEPARRDRAPIDLLLPTPKASDDHTSGPADTRRSTPGLRAITHLLQTPRASDAEKGGPNQRGSKGDLALPAAVIDWGRYLPAIERHEVAFGRSAPPPTEPSPRTGKPRLSPRFVEWMMGLPDGCVTDVPDLTRGQQLRALGNGVVPAQAYAALQWMGGGPGGRDT